jgi:peptidoglycan/xylan/chitin deacetylase (PgdA/CDA1 family)
MQLSPVTETLILAGTATAAAGLLANAAFGPESQLFGHTILAGRDPAEIALTYDDGPNDAATPQLLELLARHNARATFFLIGKHVRKRPDLARAVHAAGHLIGNHTMTHPWLAWQSSAIIRRELGDCSKLLEDTLGAPVRYMRPPHGSRRPAVLGIARELGMAVVQWNVMGQDWRPIGAAGIQRNLDRGLARAVRRGTGANILLHDGHDRTMGASRADTLACTATLLERFAHSGAHMVTVDAWG